jgi:acyl-CoA dehydrogenase
MACQVIDWAMQLHGGAAVSEDFGLARAYAVVRALRFADGRDEVHRNAIAKLELASLSSRPSAARAFEPPPRPSSSTSCAPKQR